MTDSINWERLQEQDREAAKLRHAQYERSKGGFAKAQETVLAFLQERERHRRDRAERMPRSGYGVSRKRRKAMRPGLLALADQIEAPEPEFGAAFLEIVFEVQLRHPGTPDSLVKSILRALREEGRIYRADGLIGGEPVRVFRLTPTAASVEKTEAGGVLRSPPKSILRLEQSAPEGFVDWEPLTRAAPKKTGRKTGHCGTSGTKNRRGRPSDTDPSKDARWSGEWGSGKYKTYGACANVLGTTMLKLKLALDRHRKRRKKPTE